MLLMSDHRWPLLMVALLLLVALAPLAVQAAPEKPASAVAKALPKPAGASPYDEDAALHIAESHGFYGIGRLVLGRGWVRRGTAIQFGRIVAIEIDHQGQFGGIEKRP